MAHAVHLVGDVEHLLHIVIHQRLGVVRRIVRITEADRIDRHILCAGTDGRFLEIEDIILVIESQIIIADSADEYIVFSVIDTGGYIFPVVSVCIRGGQIYRHCQRAVRLNSNDLTVASGVLIAVCPEVTRRLAGSSQTADFFHCFFLHRAALGTREVCVFLQGRAVVVNSGTPCHSSGRKARYYRYKDAFHTHKS